MAIRIRNGWISLEFSCWLPDGRKVRCSESLRLKDTKRNMELARQKDKAIKYHLGAGTFNYLQFFPHGVKAKHFRSSASTTTMREWWENWVILKSVKPTTLLHYKGHYRNHIAPHFGHYQLEDITTDQIEIFRQMLKGKGFTASTINQITKTLCSLLRKASQRGIVSTYACDEIESLTERRPDVDPFSFDELRHLLDNTRQKAPEWYDMLLLWSRTGLRPGEMYALKWANVDYFNRKLMVRESRAPGGYDDVPKTPHSSRDIDLRDNVVGALKRQEKRTFFLGGYVFLNPHGRPLNQGYFSRTFRYLLKLAELRDRPPKNMRHTFATLNIAAGEQISWVSKMLGHSDVQITLRRYNRFIPNLTRDDGSAFERVLDEAQNTSIERQRYTTD